MKPYSKKEFDTIAATVKENVERFRYDATQVYSTYSHRDRKMLRKIHPKADFYLRSQEHHYPTLKSLNRKKPYNAMTSRLAEGLVIGDLEAHALADKLYLERYEQLIQETVASLPRSSRRHATRILRLPSAQANELLDHYKQATLYRDIAQTLRISVYDPHAHVLSRLAVRRQIQRNRRQTRRREQKRIAIITSKLQKIDTEHGDLLRRIVSHNLEIMTLLGLRQEFMKKITHHSGNRRQFDQFEKTIKTFVGTQVDRYVAQSPDASLHELGNQKHSLEQILQDLFALGNAHRNQLVMLFSEYRRLYSEREEIVTAQRARSIYIDRES